MFFIFSSFKTNGQKIAKTAQFAFIQIRQYEEVSIPQNMLRGIDHLRDPRLNKVNKRKNKITFINVVHFCAMLCLIFPIIFLLEWESDSI